MTVYIGSARSDENGKAHGGQAGDQKNGQEVSTQAWYNHSKGWRVFRAKDPAHAKKIAEVMKWACGSDLIGYDQYQRHTLYNELAKYAFQKMYLSKAVETDCAALVRVCLAFCGIDMPENFYTGNMVSYLLNSGKFIELTDTKYTLKSDYLGAGDVLVTKTKGHTVVVINNGPKYEGAQTDASSVKYKLGDRILKKGIEGDDVKELQANLVKLGYSCGKSGADGDFGSGTEGAVKVFQKANGLTADGIYGAASHKAMVAALDNSVTESTGNTITITGNSVNIRKGPGTSYGVLKAAKKGDKFTRLDASGWTCVQYNDTVCWVSEKYVKNSVCTASSLNVRKGPNTSYASVGVVKSGYKFTVISTSDWVPIVIGDIIYWVSAKYAK